MKKIILALCILVFLLSFQTTFTSCKKETTVHDTVTVVKTDTLIIKDTAISLGLITANSWKLIYLQGVVGNTIYLYERGGSNNIINFDNEYLAFNQNKTGIYFDANGATHQLTWDFMNTQNTTLTFTVTNPSPTPSQVVIWDNVRYKNGALLYDEYWSLSGTNSHSQGIRISKQ
jgi:hypothetical protein